MTMSADGWSCKDDVKGGALDCRKVREARQVEMVYVRKHVCMREDPARSAMM